MADLFELIERVRVTLASSVNPDKDQLQELHSELDVEIRSANKRLRECDALLAGGHRSEAIQMAEHEPALLDVVSILDFAELPEWNDFVAELGLNVTPELHIDIAADLNRAYTEDAPLERDLRRFRLYSLIRAPLRSRLAQLRKIAELDPTNPIWLADVQSYEEVRLGQIKDDFFSANRNNDMERLQTLASELRGDWIVKPSRELIGRINQALKSLNSAKALKGLKQVAEDLRAAREDEDMKWAIELTREWDELSRKCPDDSEGFRELQTIARRTLNWVNKQQTSKAAEGESNKKIKQLQRAIETGMDADELKRRHKAATRNSDQELPDEIQQDYEQAILKIEKDRQKRTRMIYIAGGASLVVIIIILLVVFLVSNN